MASLDNLDLKILIWNDVDSCESKCKNIYLCSFELYTNWNSRFYKIERERQQTRVTERARETENER